MELEQQQEQEQEQEPVFRFTWLMDCDYRGMIPSSVVELAIPTAQLQVTAQCV